MQFGFMSGKGIVDVIFIVRHLQEKFMEKRKDLFYVFVDLEKAFDRVPRDVGIEMVIETTGCRGMVGTNSHGYI